MSEQQTKDRGVAMDHSEFYGQVHGPEEAQFNGTSHGWIQWKGTDACIDLRCVCGACGHIDAMFFYHYECHGCGRKYALSSYVKLIELTPAQAAFVENGGGCGFMGDPDTAEEGERDE